MAWGILVEALRNRSLVRASHRGRKCLVGTCRGQRQTQTRRAPAGVQVPGAGRRMQDASQQRRPSPQAFVLLSAEAWCMGDRCAALLLQATRSSRQRWWRWVECWLLAAGSQRHTLTSLLALHALSCYPTRLISPAAQRRASCWVPDGHGQAGAGHYCRGRCQHRGLDCSACLSAHGWETSRHRPAGCSQGAPAAARDVQALHGVRPQMGWART